MMGWLSDRQDVPQEVTSQSPLPHFNAHAQTWSQVTETLLLTVCNTTRATETLVQTWSNIWYNISFHCYADDTQIYMRLKHNDSQSFKCLLDCLTSKPGWL